MKQFKEMGITAEVKGFVGDKIKIDRILNKEIIVHGFEIKDSKFTGKGHGKCMYLQITFDNEKRVVFTSSVYLMNMIGKVVTDDFPFKTTIVKTNEHLEFT
jgi:hypothetical protein